jgi:hypothetical protein
MTAALGVLMPLGIMAARFFKDADPMAPPVKGASPAWFVYHRAIQAVAWAAAVAAFVLAVRFVALDAGDHFANTHSRLGFAVCCLLLFSCLKTLMLVDWDGNRRLDWRF